MTYLMALNIYSRQAFAVACIFFFVCLVVQVAAVEQAIHDTDGGWNLFVLNRRQAESSEMSASG